MLTLQKPHIPASFNMYLVINKCVTAAILSNFSRHYLRNRSTLDIGIWVTSVYFNLRNILPKSGTFLPGHPVYVYNNFSTQSGCLAWKFLTQFASTFIYQEQWITKTPVYLSRRINVRVQVTVSDWIHSVLDYWQKCMLAESSVTRKNKQVDYDSRITEKEIFLFLI